MTTSGLGPTDMIPSRPVTFGRCCHPYFCSQRVLISSRSNGMLNVNTRLYLLCQIGVSGMAWRHGRQPFSAHFLCARDEHNYTARALTFVLLNWSTCIWLVRCAERTSDRRARLKRKAYKRTRCSRAVATHATYAGLWALRDLPSKRTRTTSDKPIRKTTNNSTFGQD